ncbi:alkaline phosphatase family protein [Diaminobutyricibacter tongyongensis]|uniref:Alkaline phosphatase family protein n=2 Tax=Leifsonia tongyongensis TaxID=1268043 RepID=A0A6L9XY51_9MICO|nr:alkaline phosphatase family protein [Diaminobutyricibacter tongyongensis]
MLPAAFTTQLSLAAVLSSSMDAVLGVQNPLGLRRVERMIVVVVDGLGANSLRARSGHARFLAPFLTKASTIDSGFPTTTAAALATLCTGTTPGTHGLVGYRVLDAASDRMVNQLNGWDDRLDPATWQRSETVFERATMAGVRSYAIGQPRYRDSGFTHAVLRGAEYVPGKQVADRFAAARDILRRPGPSLTYLYVSELDTVAHASGWESPAWTAELEALDGQLATLSASLGRNDGILVTADHGVIDVPQSSHVLFDTVPKLVAGVEFVGGEPRCLQLYLTDRSPAAADRLAATWQDVEGERSWVATREQAVEAGWFGDAVDEVVLPRIGDVLVAARRRIAYYDSRDPLQSGRNMVGQHGSLTPEETRVPLIRLGAIA